MATADEHSFFIDANGKLGAWTLNDKGILEDRRMMKNGDNYTGIEFTSVTSSTSHKSQMIALVSRKGDVYTLGNGDYGRLGHGECEFYMSLTKVAALENYRVTSIAADWHCIAVTDTGVAFSWGLNKRGQCGLGHFRNQITTPSRINMPDAPDPIWCIASVGELHSLLVDADGTVYAFGYGWDGALGNGSINRSLPAKVILPSKCISVAAGTAHSLAVTEEGDVFAWGDDTEGELGVIVQGRPIGVIQHAGGDIRTIHRSRGRPVIGQSLTYTEPPDEYSTYQGPYAQVSEINHEPRYSHIPKYGPIIDEKRYEVPYGVDIQQVFSPRYNMNPDPRTVRTPQPVRLTNVRMVSTFQRESCAVTNNGELYMWGTRNYTNDTTVTTSQPTLVDHLQGVLTASMSNMHTIAVTKDGEVYRWNQSDHTGARKQLIYTFP